MDQKKLKGTGVAIVTPFRNDGSIDFKSLDKLIDHLLVNGIDYLVVLGTTGESVTQSRDEACAIINFVKDKVEQQVPIVIGIGGNNTQQVVNVIHDTDFDGIDAVLSVSPYYNKPTQEGIYQHYKEIASVCPVPVILYNVPGRTGSNICAKTTLKLANDFSNIVAIKEASGDFQQITQILRDKPADFLVISGDDGLTLPMLSLGASGVISVIANAFPRHFSQMVNLALNNEFEEARKIHLDLSELVISLFQEGNPGGVNAALEIMNITTANLRLPLVPISKELYKKIETQINNVPAIKGVFSQSA